jgi:PAS domain S-box-containing protein
MERVERYEASQTEDGRYRLLVEAVTDYAIYMLDPSGTITSWNRGAERIKGYLPDEIIGEHFSRFYTAEDLEAAEPKHALETALAAGRYEKEGWRVRKDGSRFWANVVIDPIRSEDGQLLGFAKVTRDITNQLEARQQLEQAREALFQSQKMEAIGQLTGGIAHDFNNLLMAIHASLELLTGRRPEDPRNPALIRNALSATQRGIALTQRMLAFSRRQELKLEAVDVPALVRGMTELLERSLGASVRIELRFPPSLPLALADYNQLELALLNLAVNARDAMPDGGSIVIAGQEIAVVDAAADLKPGWYVCLSVTDTGHGMDEATLSRALDPFFTTKGVGKGTGLGLPMALGLAAQCGGRLTLKSRVGEGTTAELMLPIATAPPNEHGNPSGAVRPNAAEQPLRVLAVDDDALVLVNTSAMLEELGHTPFVASSAEEALRLLDEGTAIDLVVTDHAMPKITGSQLAETIGARWPGVRIILATGYAELPPGTATGLPRLSKPFRQADLARAIADLGTGASVKPARAQP